MVLTKDPRDTLKRGLDMQYNTSTGNRVAAFFSAMAITGLMLTAYFAPPASAAVGIVA